jgi:hypothetical protein
MSESKPTVFRKGGTIAPEEFTEEELAFFQGWQPVTEMIGRGVAWVSKWVWWHHQ